jgi:stress-induced morphogen
VPSLHRDVIMLARLGRTGTQTLSRFYATLTEAEKTIEQKLRAGLKVVDINVKDTSGGCGAMYSIEITADDFK